MQDGLGTLALVSGDSSGDTSEYARYKMSHDCRKGQVFFLFLSKLEKKCDGIISDLYSGCSFVLIKDYTFKIIPTVNGVYNFNIYTDVYNYNTGIYNYIPVYIIVLFYYMYVYNFIIFQYIFYIYILFYYIFYYIRCV